MRKKKKGRRGRRWFGALVGLAGLTAGALGATVLMRRRGGGDDSPPRKSIYPEYNRGERDRWARPGMYVTFRAELMPGRSRAERTYRVETLLQNNRVMLEEFTGEHTESEFEPVR